MCKHIVVELQFMYELERFQITKVTFKLTQGHWQSYHSIGYIWFTSCLLL